MDELAAWVCIALAVPAALVSLVGADQQVVPGMTGLREPWVSQRSARLTFPFCRHVVTTAQPLVITDARVHHLARDDLAIADVGVVAFAGMPLVDDAGNVLGALCAIDHEPRDFTPVDLDTLRNIARACSTELQLRLARHDADREGDRRDEVERAQRRASDRSRTLLLASQAFTETTTVADVRARIDEMAGTELRATYVGIVMLDERRRLRSLDALTDQGGDAASPSFGLGTVLPSATAVRERRIVHYPDRTSFDRDHPAAARDRVRALGLHSVVAVPVPGAEGPVGAIVLGWDVPNAIEPEDLPTIATIAGYTGHALGRARFLQHRTSAAHEMQTAMLTTLPVVPGLAMAARYTPADSREHVGGDWYDAAPVLDPGHARDQLLAVSVGDIIGHTLQAATIMGQVRSMLRQSAWDHPGGPPSEILGAFEAANLGLGLAAAGTAVVAHLRRAPGERWSLLWTNAGHPAPYCSTPAGPPSCSPTTTRSSASACRPRRPAATTTATSRPAPHCSSTPTASSSAAGATSTSAPSRCSPCSTRFGTGRPWRSSTPR
jgi:GAF domain-containing protein